ncbi:MAG: mechanosensitive ion channel domain-containing protein [Pseudomonadales bacterium]
MDAVVDTQTIDVLLEKFEMSRAYLFSIETLIEIGIVLALALVAFLLTRSRRQYLTEHEPGYPLLARGTEILAMVAFPLTWLILQWLANLIAHILDWREGLLIVTASLLTAWVVIRVASVFIENPVVSKGVAMLAWTVAALNILGLLDDTAAILDSVGMTFGDARITLLTLFKGVASLVVLLWASNIISEFFEKRISATTELTASVQVLFSKLFKIVLFAVAVFAAIGTVGIDLTAFAFLGGAIGVGIGFGLQKIVANLISGVILLLDNSIKPGDVIVVGEYYGRVDSLGARYVSVTTRDGVEHLIPNEDLIVNRVENWSHSNNLLRLRTEVGVHYKSDVKKAMALCLEAAAEVPRVLEDPAPSVLMRGFGDSSVDLEVRYWIDDPMNGRANVGSALLVNIWDKFAANDIEIPFPQRDLHLRTPTWDEVKEFGLSNSNPAVSDD